MSDYSIMLEHTLVLAGDIVDSGAVWQGWPSSTHISLERHRKTLMSLINKVAFPIAGAVPGRAVVRALQRREDAETVDNSYRSSKMDGTATDKAVLTMRTTRHVSFQGDTNDERKSSSVSEITPLLSGGKPNGHSTFV